MDLTQIKVDAQKVIDDLNALPPQAPSVTVSEINVTYSDGTVVTFVPKV